jgi:hypothetical protein
MKRHKFNTIFSYPEHMGIFTKRFKLVGPSKLQSAKSLEGTSLCNACSHKKKEEKQFSPHVIGMSCS